MALTDAQVSTIFEIIALPESGTTTLITDLVHYPYSNTGTWEPGWNVGDLSALVTRIKANIAAMSSTTEARVTSLLDDWDEMGSSNLKVTASQQAAGVLVDYKGQREHIREEIGNLIGLAVPKGGFIGEMQRIYGIRQGCGTPGSIGDR